jgi:hypothetical protein
MNDHLRQDVSDHPDLFWFSKPLGKTELQQAKLQWSPPGSLLSFWEEFGGGLMFESEEMLRPFSKDVPLDLITAQLKPQGMPNGLTVFHVGVVVSGFSPDGFRAFDADSYAPLGLFVSLDDWYLTCIRGLFAQRYGLLV